MIALSRAAQCLWAKKANDGSMLWLPLWMHMSVRRSGPNAFGALPGKKATAEINE